ncbi:carboxyl transferase domain-containing protein [Embleya scabrispora]|uniref:carboxyl transferase domain-containing protein n=1 Tax=Embleya scabrispora TaxID=159449 RepID=UPI0003821A92|nr:carboxyl transferase domain-containing protein [Embleya scabrispora]MYS80754.1 acetyl-CoA carboxyl transferase [Streptomyces sp. SID5474]
MPKRQTARDLIASILDPDSWVSWDTPIVPAGRDAAYDSELTEARLKTGVDGAVLTGEGRIHGRRIALLVSEFRFLGGSIGVREAERIVDALERATRAGLPVLALPASGGTRMQEGTPAFVHMADICAAVVRHKRVGLPYLVHLRHPTTGGVMASWGALGHITTAEPGALLGFLGPRVFETLTGTTFPADVQTAENLFAHGLVDAVVPATQLADLVARIVRLNDITPACPRPPGDHPAPAVDAWDAIRRTRRRGRPGLRQLVDRAEDVVPLNGTGHGEREPSMYLGLMRFGNASCVVVGHDRTAEAESGPAGPAGLRTARRGMHLAEELGLPLLTVIDTAGATLSVAAEEGGLAKEIAACLAELTTLRTPTVSLLLGRGTGGGALALLPADRVLAAQNAWVAPLPPEGASAIVHGHPLYAADMSRAQRVGAEHLLASGTVDRIIPESPDACDAPHTFMANLRVVVEAELSAAVQAGYDTERRTARSRGTGATHAAAGGRAPR